MPPGIQTPRSDGAVHAPCGVETATKFVYLASITSYFTFYLIQRFHTSVGDAQLHLFVFLAAVAVGTIWAVRSAIVSGASA